MDPLHGTLNGRNETPLERCDRNFVELLQEVRVAQTGVQVLFGFLLTVPFTVRFEEIGALNRAIYFGTLLAAGAAAMLLIAPTSHHRILFRCGDKEHIVRVANRYALAGLAAVAVAMIGVVLLVSRLVVGSALAAAITALATAVCCWCWWCQPLLRRRHVRARSAATPDRFPGQDHAWRPLPEHAPAVVTAAMQAERSRPDRLAAPRPLR
jgi:hypothetical protein